MLRQISLHLTFTAHPLRDYSIIIVIITNASFKNIDSGIITDSQEVAKMAQGVYFPKCSPVGNFFLFFVANVFYLCLSVCVLIPKRSEVQGSYLPVSNQRAVAKVQTQLYLSLKVPTCICPGEGGTNLWELSWSLESLILDPAFPARS